MYFISYRLPEGAWPQGSTGENVSNPYQQPSQGGYPQQSAYQVQCYAQLPGYPPQTAPQTAPPAQPQAETPYPGPYQQHPYPQAYPQAQPLPQAQPAWSGGPAAPTGEPNILANAAVALGFLSVVGLAFYGIGGLCGIPGIAVGVTALRRSQVTGTGRGLAIGGIALSVLGILIGISVAVLVFELARTPG